MDVSDARKIPNLWTEEWEQLGPQPVDPLAVIFGTFAIVCLGLLVWAKPTKRERGDE